MKKVLLGTFFTAALMIAGTTNASAQKIKGKSALKKGVAVEQVKDVAKSKDAIKAVNKENIKVTPGKVNAIKKAKIETPGKVNSTKLSPKANKAVKNELTKGKMKAKSSKLNKKK